MENEKFQDLVLDHLAKITQELTEVNSKIGGLETDVSRLKMDVSELKTDVSGLKTDVSELKSDVSGLKTDVSELKADVSVLKVDMEQVKGSVIQIENEHGEKLNALFNGHEVMIDRSERLLESQSRTEGKLDRLSLKVSAHEVELRKAK